MINQKRSQLSLSNLIEITLQGLSPIQTIMKMAEDHHIRMMGFDPLDIISFGGGWCNHSAPELLRRCYQEIINDKDLFHQSGRYSPIKGSYECMEQLCHFEKKIHHIPGLTVDNIVLGHSSTQLMHDLLRVLQNPGSDICVLDPTYANYANTVKCALPGSSIRFVPALDPCTWTYLSNPQRSLDMLQKYCEHGAKTFIIPVPDNPTSQVPQDEFIRAAAEIMVDHQGYLVLDFAYKELCFDKIPSCFSWSPNQYEHVIMVHSHSKWLSSLGRRFGWIEAHPTIINGVEKITESTLLSPDTLHSMVTTRFLQESLKDQSLRRYLDDIRSLYKRTADVLIDQINIHLDWQYLQPQGGLYTVCPTPNEQEPVSFVEHLLQKTGVLLIPGIGFGPSMSKAVRISYGSLCHDHEKIKEGIERIGSYI